MNTFAFTLDLSKTAYMEPLRIRQGDHNGTTVQAAILDHGVALEGYYTARFCMRHPGTGATYYRETGTYANGVATIALDEQYAASVPGRTTAYIQLLQGSTIIASTSDIPVVILHDATEDAVPGEVYDSAIEDAIAELDEATGRISVMVQEQVAEELAAHPEWTTTVQDNSLTDAKLVQSGGILSRNQRLMYRLANLLTHRTDEGTLAAISDAAKTPLAGLSLYGRSTQDGTPTPSAPVPIVSVEGDSEGNISLLARGFNQFDASMAVMGELWNGSGGTSINSNCYRSPLIEVFPSTAYYTNADSTGFTYTVRFFDAGKGFIGSDSLTTAGVFTTPANCRYIGISSMTANVPPSELVLNLSDTARNGTYAPYTSTSTPIDLDGHELRSLPDGTRDELTVDAEGHVTLVQRVGEATVSAVSWLSQGSIAYASLAGVRSGYFADAIMSDHFSGGTGDGLCRVSGGNVLFASNLFSDASTASTWFAANPTEVLYPLATPVTHDLGTVPLVPLVGPDLTAQTVPTAPFVLDAERDLNVTLARLESAIAALA